MLKRISDLSSSVCYQVVIVFMISVWINFCRSLSYYSVVSYLGLPECIGAQSLYTMNACILCRLDASICCISSMRVEDCLFHEKISYLNSLIFWRKLILLDIEQFTFSIHFSIILCFNWVLKTRTTWITMDFPMMQEMGGWYCLKTVLHFSFYVWLSNSSLIMPSIVTWPL